MRHIVVISSNYDGGFFKVHIDGVLFSKFEKSVFPQAIGILNQADLDAFKEGTSEPIPFTINRGAELPDSPFEVLAVTDNPDNTCDLLVGTVDKGREYLLKNCIRKQYPEESDEQYHVVTLKLATTQLCNKGDKK